MSTYYGHDSVQWAELCDMKRGTIDTPFGAFKSKNLKEPDDSYQICIKMLQCASEMLPMNFTETMQAVFTVWDELFRTDLVK